MEAFSLLKYWRGGSGGGGDGGVVGDHNIGVSASKNSKPITSNGVADDDNNEENGNDDDGPFFDLEFSVNDDDEEDEDGVEEQVEEAQKCDEEEEEEDEDEESEFKFTLSSGSSNNDRTDGTDNIPNLSLSPSDDLFFKGKLVPIESFPSDQDQPNSKPVMQFPVSLLKSATKFRVFMLGLKKSKANSSVSTSTEKPESAATAGSSSKEEQPKKRKQQQAGKFFTVKFKVEEVPIVSLFTRDNSSRVSSKQSSDNDSSSSSSSSSDEKRFAKEVMQRYLKMVKPLYVRVSRRYGEKLRLSGHLSLKASLSKSPSRAPADTAEKSSEPEVVSEAPASSNAKSLKQVNLPAGLRVVRKHLGKSRSASAAGPAAVAVTPPETASSRRRDDSLLQQQDGIQSAILHCKRSFNAIRDSEASLLSRSVSDPSRKSSEAAKV
ncbi:probable membrane-associated kinase regulator 2 [Morus notabilis]|uniref:probable membrane-associated kinase regulator 2 n=1 Tax=Morus notabilis TaxID=981085 RepID=UPI000CED628B|nr:probable membrane-associated kinase regulator 2 [Morus notabilis]